jgi:hypothetical protein
MKNLDSSNFFVKSETTFSFSNLSILTS